MEEQQEEKEVVKKLTKVEEARQATKELNEAMEKMEVLRKSLEEAEAEAIVSGRADAGTVKEVKKEETPAEYSKRVTQEGYPK